MTENEKLDLILGTVQTMAKDIAELKAEMKVVKADIEVLKADIEVLKAEMKIVQSNIAELTADVAELRDDVEDLKDNVSSLTNRMQAVENSVAELRTETRTEIQALRKAIRKVKHQVAQTSLTLENEIRVNIERIAEGHLDLVRHLKSAARVDAEQELLSVRVMLLGSEVRKIKDQLVAQSA